MKPIVTAGGTWNLKNSGARYCNDLDEQSPPTQIFVKVEFIGDDGKAEAVVGSWEAPSAPK